MIKANDFINDNPAFPVDERQNWFKQGVVGHELGHASGVAHDGTLDAQCGPPRFPGL